MPFIAASALVIAVLMATAGSAQMRDLVGASFAARVVSVVDGDTVDVLLPGETRAIRIRLEGVDAPERGEPFNAAATRSMRVMLFEKTARLEGRAVDRYGRLVARISIDGRDASMELAKSGLACHYTQYLSDAALARAQEQARREGLGFWASTAAKPRCTAAVASASAPRPAPQAVTHAFHGSTSSRLYHAPGCRNYHCRNCTRTFRSESEAKAAGFRPAGDCLRR
jgi:endonuclease YncB( thermonuclease family)